MHTVSVVSHYDAHPFPQTPGDTIRQRAARFATAFPLLAKTGPCRVLDAGCGTGSFANTFALFNPAGKIDAINISPVSLQWGRDQAKRLGIENVEFSERSLFDVDQTYDLIISHGVLHHTGDADKGLDILCRAVAPGGTLSVSLYHFGRWPIRIRRRILTLLHGRDSPEARIKSAKSLFARTCNEHIRKGGLSNSSPEIQDAAIADMFAVPIETYHRYSKIAAMLKARDFTILSRSSDKGRSISMLTRIIPLDLALDLKGIILRQKQFHIIARRK